MTEVDRRVSSPHFNTKFLEWYADMFDCVFIALHPFSRIESLDPEHVGYRPFYADGRQLSPQEVLLRSSMESKYKDLSPNEFAVIQKRGASLISWQEICDGIGIRSLSALNRILLTTTMALNQRFWDEEGAEQLEHYAAANKIFLPREDFISVLLETEIAKLIMDLGADKVKLLNEFGDQFVEVEPHSLITEKPWHQSGLTDFWVVQIYPQNHSFYISGGFDDFYTIVAGKRAQLEPLKLTERFEGFWCDELTRPVWFMSDSEYFDFQNSVKEGESVDETL